TKVSKILKARRSIVFERHIDEVLANKLVSDQRFARILITAIARLSKTSLHYDQLRVIRQARHKSGPGSIDLLVYLLSKDSRETACILIENKIDSAFTPTQPERYVASAAAVSGAGRPAVTVLCAPGEYISRSRYVGSFNAQISYEQLAEWFCGGDRGLVRQAIKRFSMPFEPAPVSEVERFHRDYRQIAQLIAPELVIKPNPNTSGARPGGSTTIYYDTGNAFRGGASYRHSDFLTNVGILVRRRLA
ncbi:MAG: hypothetical protein ACREEZ_03875, partial [Stellaceae bacterium]